MSATDKWADSEYLLYYIFSCALSLSKPPNTVEWSDLREWLLKENKSKAQINIIQRKYKNWGGFNSVRDAFFQPVVTSPQIDSLAVRTAAKIQNREKTENLQNELWLAKLDAVLAKHLKNIKPFGGKVATTANRKAERAVLLFLSDLHIGARLSQKEVLFDFGPTETARRLAYIVKNVLTYKVDHRSETECVVMLNGDLIQGMLGHGPDGSEAIALQLCELQHLLIQILRLLRYGSKPHKYKGFEKVTVYCQSGNHDRNVAVHKDRATHQRINSMVTSVFDALRRYFEDHHEGVKIVIPQTPFCEFEILGHSFFAAHGDTILGSVGSPGSSINVSALTKELNKINIGRVQRNLQPHEVFLVGHVHFGAAMPVPGGYFLITNPALIHRDAHALNYGQGQSMGQWLTEVTREFAVGDIRPINIDFKIDQDKSLDSLIQKFEGL